MHGQFIWYELTTPDVAAAQTFYPTFTGWATQPFGDDYTMWTTDGLPFAGLFRLTDEMRQQGVPPNWMPYVESSDVDETAVKAASLGGRVVHGPRDIPGVGRYAVIEDPQGAVFGAYKSANRSIAWDGTPVVGRFSWHELMTTDYVEAFEFYRALFGWEKTGEMDMGGGEMYFMFGRGDKMYGGMFNRPPEMAGMHPFWLVYIHVKDVGEALATATTAGASIHRPQMDIPGGSIAILGDPQGAGFAVHHASAAVAASQPVAKKGASTRRTTSAKKSSAKKASAKKASAKKASAKKPGAKKSAAKKTTTARRSKVKTAAARKGRPKAKAKARTKSKARPKAKARTKSKSATRKRARRAR
ncbi:MAG: putative hydroxylase [Geminicoccaceae bacterium]|nr:putative hydroxylase [Geminicoccaceae bacterium]